VRLPERVSIVDVAPRDGLQSLPATYPLATKLALIDLLVEAGLRKIEATAFVRPDVVPQLADADELLRRARRADGCVLRALVPNRRGAERALEAGAGELLALTTASETYSRLNANMTVAESLDAVSSVLRVAGDAGVPVVVAVGVALYCPYEGDIPESRVFAMLERLVAEGVEEVYVATSAGLDGPRAVYSLCSRVVERWPSLRLGLHLHNTNGMALANALAGAQAGVTVFEGAVCGIGGGLRMPGGPAGYGNVATEDLVNLFAELGVDTGLDLAALVEAARRAGELLGLGETASYALGGGTKAGRLTSRGEATPPAS
jgi:hydroxymethylglutaryl-CoA lyase